ncbi:cytochrome b [Shinella zoogloeoides]|uniref:cytochrome b n=1 Tax=Shinella zoogloeoides TaxID=352475 RepID=UPI000E655D4C|nr:cytochrome b/b6 domain-containing protein [Shinella zoogloeoides]
MATTASLSFSLPQRILHWLTAGLVFFNLLLPDGMNAWNRSMKQTGAASAEQVTSANIHAYAGIAILVLVAVRLMLRHVQGVPAAPAAEPAIFRSVAKISEWTLYLLLLVMPLTGAAAYYLGYEVAGDLHADVLKAVLWAVVGLHVLGALAHQFYWKTNVLRRMTVG